MKQINQRDAEHYIATREEFNASALTGRIRDYTPDGGRLNPEEYAKLTEAGQASKWLYVVYSYGTPIAWHSNAGWYVVGQKFSVTTSKHQSAVRRAISSELVGA